MLISVNTDIIVIIKRIEIFNVTSHNGLQSYITYDEVGLCLQFTGVLAFIGWRRGVVVSGVRQ